MQLLITGGTGFIGSRLALKAREHGWTVVATGLTNTDAERSRARELEAHGLHVELGALQDPEFARRVVSDCDVVIHLAAAQHESNVGDGYFRDVNVGATRTLLGACTSARVKRFVYGSTIGVYGSAGAAELTEDSPPRPQNVYGRTKLEAEDVVKSYAGRVPSTIVRISETYGPGDFRLLKLFRAIQRGVFVMVGSGLNRHQVIYVDDVARGLLIAATHSSAIGGTFVLAGQEPLSTRDMVRHIAAALERSPPRIRVPIAPFLLGAALMESVMPAFGIQPPLHRRRLDFFRKSFLFSGRKAESVLGFKAVVPFETGVRQAVHWYRRHGYLDGARGARRRAPRAIRRALSIRDSTGVTLPDEDRDMKPSA